MEQQQQHVNEEESRFVFGDLVPLNLSSVVEQVLLENSFVDTLRWWILVFIVDRDGLRRAVIFCELAVLF